MQLNLQKILGMIITDSAASRLSPWVIAAVEPAVFKQQWARDISCPPLDLTLNFPTWLIWPALQVPKSQGIKHPQEQSTEVLPRGWFTLMVYSKFRLG